MQKIIIIVASALLLGACATIVKGTTQTVTVNTPGVPGAMCTLTSEGIGTKYVQTPGSITLEKSKSNIAVRCTKECYIDGVGTISSNFQAITAGNIILGGVVGLGIDAASGAMNEYTPDIQVMLQPDPKCARPEPKVSEPRRRR